MRTFQDVILLLKEYWSAQDCVILEAIDLPVGAGTFHPGTAFKALGEDSWRVAYVQPSKRPGDGRYGENPNRLQTHHQFQVFLKPSLINGQKLYLQSLEAVGINLKEHDIRFVEDNWESHTLGACGLGWEVWCDGMEITQFTYFQKFAGIDCFPVSTEITYGLERLVMHIQAVDNVYDIMFTNNVKYGDIFLLAEKQECLYALQKTNAFQLFETLENSEKECNRLINEHLTIPAYRCFLESVHVFNMLDARGVISTTQRQLLITRLRTLVHKCLKAQLLQEKLYTKNILLPSESRIIQYSAIDYENNSYTELFIELLIEEVPAQYQKIGANSWLKFLTDFLKKSGVSVSDGHVFYTPRRIVVYWERVSTQTNECILDIKGPAIDAHSDSINGFLKKMQITRQCCQERYIKGKKFLFFQKKIISQKTSNIISQAIMHALHSVTWKRSMRIGQSNFSWVRPIQDIYVVYKKKQLMIELFIDGFYLKSSGYIYGNRSLGEEGFVPLFWNHYKSGLRERYVIIDQKERALIIRNQLNDLNWISDESLLEEVTNLVEYPVVVEGEIPLQFQYLPLQVISVVLRVHQRYFICQDNKFAVVSNTVGNCRAIIQGYIRVLTARLQDASFCICQDQKKSLHAWRDSLQDMYDFRETVYDKTEKLAILTQRLCACLFPSISEELAYEAGALSKADLATSMVSEFPQLQGFIGGYYTENPLLKEALTMQYMPITDSDPLPESALAIALALADKLHRLVLFWKFGEIPTGSKDPYALRRSAIGIVRILWKKNLFISLETLINLWEGSVQLLNFIFKRFERILQDEENISHEIITSMQMKHSLPLYIIAEDCLSIRNFMQERPNDIESIINTTKRFKNIMRKQTKERPKVEEPLAQELLIALDSVAKNPRDWHKYYIVSSTANKFFDSCFVQGNEAREALIGYGSYILTKRVDFSYIGREV